MRVTIPRGLFEIFMAIENAIESLPKITLWQGSVIWVIDSEGIFPKKEFKCLTEHMSKIDGTRLPVALLKIIAQNR